MTDKLTKLTPKKGDGKGKATGKTKKAFTRLTKKQVVEALRKVNGLVSLAAKALNVSTQTIYNWRDKSPEVAQEIENARTEIVDLAEHGLRGAVIRQEGWAVCFTLKTLGKERGYVERVEQTGKGGEPIQHAFTTMEEWKKQAAERRAQAAKTQELFNDESS